MTFDEMCLIFIAYYYYIIKINLKGNIMKEYKVEIVKPAMNTQKTVENFEFLLNNMAEQGWEFKFQSGMWWIFEREKQ